MVAGAIGAKPGSDGDSSDDRSDAFHVEASVAFVTEEKLVATLARPALLAAHVAVVVFLNNCETGLRHYFR